MDELADAAEHGGIGFRQDAVSQVEDVARVARALGVTRRTIYMRMQRFGILRRRVPKILKQHPA